MAYNWFDQRFGEWVAVPNGWIRCIGATTLLDVEWERRKHYKILSFLGPTLRYRLSRDVSVLVRVWSRATGPRVALKVDAVRL